MDIFLWGMAQQTSQKSLETYLRKRLKEFQIDVFYCNKFPKKGCALLTVLDAAKGERFLRYHQSEAGDLYLGNKISCKPGSGTPDKDMLRALEKDAKDLKQKAPPPSRVVETNQPRAFKFVRMSCGSWSHSTNELTFEAAYQSQVVKGTLIFGKSALACLFSPSRGSSRAVVRMDIPYHIIRLATTQGNQNCGMLFTLYQAPKVVVCPEASLERQLQALSIVGETFNSTPQRIRVTGIDREHSDVMGCCFVYRLDVLKDDLVGIRNIIRQRPKMPPLSNWPCKFSAMYLSPVQELESLSHLLTREYQHISDFGLNFQIQRLAQNGFLSPRLVIQLLPRIFAVVDRSGLAVAAQAVQRLSKKIPFAGPDTDPEIFSLRYLLELLHAAEETSKREPDLLFRLEKRHGHIVRVHKAIITPAGIYLEGPVLEAKNRVLRMYPNHILSSFLRVSFSDEDGQSLAYDRLSTSDVIRNDRFKSILDSHITVAGKKFEFLGFSHSSLREQSCWFMAPLFHQGTRVTAREVILKLGEFSEFRSPAKCAARIGQAFTDSQGGIVTIPSDIVQDVPDVERSGRVFSDGCGSFSLDTMHKIWKQCKFHPVKPTVFQIRYAGAKGVISLDSRLEGEKVCIRKSMTKFKSPHTDIEIVGSARRSLPFYLNRSLIQILEDLGVPRSVFMALQAEAIDELRAITTSPINASSFLERTDTGKVADLPWLIEKLNDIGIKYNDDHFLRQCVEMTVVQQLRALKQKARIPIKNGVTLFGIMDETDSLAEGEIYCCLEKRQIVGRVAITRSPAMHPGDIQIVNAIRVPENSPIAELFNCVIFSQRGERDLASQLSGGDLDGDIFNIIYDERLIPRRLVKPADYPRAKPVDIGRPVVRGDITNFFLDFMANDRVGAISTQHLQTADLLGTLHSDCVKLAELASVAVDFSKTGIPVDMKECPKRPRVRPDFMVPNPRVEVTKNSIDFETEATNDYWNEEDLVAALDPDEQPFKYYESDKALGHLYRAIDERVFFAEVQKAVGSGYSPRNSVLDKIWQHVQKQTSLLQWKHLLDWADGIREEYEEFVDDLTWTHSPLPQKSLTEHEVFLGDIIGGQAMPTRRNKSLATDLKQEFDAGLAYIRARIVSRTPEDPDNDKPVDKALERTVACLSAAMEANANVDARPSYYNNYGSGVNRLQSFAYIAAALCLREIDRSTLGRRVSDIALRRSN